MSDNEWQEDDSDLEFDDTGCRCGCEDAKANAFPAPEMPTEESQADKGIAHPLVSCSKCDTDWRSHTTNSLCPKCGVRVGERMLLDKEQLKGLFEAVDQLKLIGLSFTQPQMSFEFGKFSVLLREHAPWYDRGNRKLIQACHRYICIGCAGLKANLAIAFFENAYRWASDTKETFCREPDY
jgi:hypothetical protein